MIIRRLSLLEGAKKAEGLVVIIDVFRAFSLECYLFSQGIEKIYPVADVSEVDTLKTVLSKPVTFGERGGIKLEGFDHGNSPFNIKGIDFKGKSAIHTTSAGTQGLVASKNVDTLITGSFVNAQAISRFILEKQPKVVSLVAMGSHGLEKTEEDELCSEYIESLLIGKNYMDQENLLKRLKEAGHIFLESVHPDSMPKEDYEMCLAMNKFDFVIEVKESEHGLECSKLEY